MDVQRRTVVGVDPSSRAERDPGLVRVRRDAYVDATAWSEATDAQRYLAMVDAVAQARPGAVFGLQAGLALAGLPFGPVPTTVQTIGGHSTSGRRGGVAHTHVDLADADIEVDGRGIARCAAPYLLADAARRLPQVVAVSALDAALAAELVDRDSVLGALARQGPRGRRRGEWVVGFADGRSESVGESVSRVAIHRIGAPAPELQAEIATLEGWRRLDFRWRRSGGRPLAGEFDGATKYGELALLDGRKPVDALVREKRREDAIRATHDVARWMWIDALQPHRLLRILGAAGLPVGTRILPGW